MTHRIPEPVAEVVGEVVGDHYYNHRKIESLFERAGAPGTAPEGSCVTKSTEWLRRCSSDPGVDALAVLGKVLEPVMGYEPEAEGERELVDHRRNRVERVLSRNGLSYVRGGVVTSNAAPVSLALGAMVREHDLPNVEIEFERAMANVEADPPAALCAACAILEALMRSYIEEKGLVMPRKPVLKTLWKVVRKDLGQDPGELEDEDVKRILSGQISLIDGIASLRTHASSAHGRGRKSYRVDAALAEYVVNSAHSFAVFQIRRWMERDAEGGRKRSKSRTRAVSRPDATGVLARIRREQLSALS